MSTPKGVTEIGLGVYRLVSRAIQWLVERMWSAFLSVKVSRWIGVPLAYVLTRYTSIDIVNIYAICEGTALIKVFIGFAISASGVWMQNIVE